MLALLSLTYVLNFIDRQILAMLIEPIKKEFGVSDTAMGFLSGFAFVFFYTIAGIPVARWADRGSRKVIITAALVIWSAMTAACGLARSFAQLAVARVLVGIGEAGGSPPAHSLIADYFPPRQRATALAIYAWGVYIGAALAFLAGGYLIQRYDWRMAFLIVGLPGVALALLFGLTVREPPRGWSEGRDAAPMQPLGETLRHLLALRAFVLIVLGSSIQSLSGYGVLTWGTDLPGARAWHGLGRYRSGARLHHWGCRLPRDIRRRASGRPSWRPRRPLVHASAGDPVAAVRTLRRRVRIAADPRGVTAEFHSFLCHGRHVSWSDVRRDPGLGPLAHAHAGFGDAAVRGQYGGIGARAAGDRPAQRPCVLCAWRRGDSILDAGDGCCRRRREPVVLAVVADAGDGTPANRLKPARAAMSDRQLPSFLPGRPGPDQRSKKNDADGERDRRIGKVHAGLDRRYRRHGQKQHGDHVHRRR
ncbi:MAG: MFS transporter [Rhodocyclaceae bacterium]|nr:MFS transporter [Rhodocyclaceae bacterium]